jgi:hypothetical protein
MDLLFIEGIAAVVSAVVIFCGSVFLILAMVVGGRLAYFVTASITLGFLVMMGVVWSINPLGPVGELPEWTEGRIAEAASDIDFAPAAEYPEGPWEAVDPEDQAQVTQASELESAATDVLEEGITEGEITTVEAASDAIVNTDLTRLLQQGDALYGAVTFAPLRGEGEVAVAVLTYDPGNPLGPPRMITAGTLVLFVLHLFGLSRSERRARSSGNGG